MNSEIPKFPDYGDGGDRAGAHRTRKAFRLCVVAVAALTASMWIAENYFRYGQAEMNYRSALTLPKDSSRVLFISAIKQDAENSEKKSAKYSRALAVRSEDDIILERYDEAQAIDNNNASFTLRHGSRLFIKGYPAQALAKYQRAEILLDDDTQNLLPAYLQAAAIAQQRNDPGAVAEAMVLVARTNNREGTIQFPRPFWFIDLPQTGSQYAMLQREIIDESCAPLYSLANITEKAVIVKIDNEQYQEARTWIGHLQTMGERLVNASDPFGSLQAFAGVTIQNQCVELSERIENKQSGAVSEETIQNRIKLTQARDTLVTYESDRDTIVSDHISLIKLPNKLAFGTLFMLALVWFLAWCVYRIFKLPKSVWTLKHGLFGRIVLSGATIAYLFLLLTLNGISVLSSDTQSLATVLMWVWVGMTAAVLLLGQIYPATVLTNVEEASRKVGRPEEMESVVHYAKIAYRKAYISLTLRYYGVLIGCYTVCMCVWIIGYSIFYGVFPWQVNLIANGFLDDEVAVVKSILGAL